MLSNYRTAFFLIYCLYYCVYFHAGMNCSKRPAERVFECSTIHYCVAFFLKTTILLYLSSCAVEAVPMTTRVMELQLCMTKIYFIKLAMRWKSDIALHSPTVTLLVKNKCVLYWQKMLFIYFLKSQPKQYLTFSRECTYYVWQLTLNSFL